jgi:hypothetical protein
MADKQLDIGKGEQGGVGRGAGVLAGAHEKEKSDGEHVGNGNVVGSANNGHGIGGMDDNGDRDGLDLVRWQISVGVATTELALEAEVNGAGGGEARVTGPQSGKALAHHAECVLHCARANWLAAGGEVAIPVALGEELEEEHRVRDIGEGLIGAEGLAESTPVETCLIVGSGA